MTHVNDIRIVVRVLVRTLFGAIVVIGNTFGGCGKSYFGMLGYEKILSCRGRLKKFRLLVRITSSRVISEGLLVDGISITFDAKMRNRSLVFVGYRTKIIKKKKKTGNKVKSQESNM